MANRLEIRIDAADGSVHLGPLVFTDRAPMAQVRETAAALIYRENDIKNGYFWLSLGDLLLGGQSAGMGLCFFQGGLEMITLGVALPDDKLFENWPTEETSRRQAKFMQKALEQQLRVTFSQGAADFPWGCVWSRFDPRGFSASAGVAYVRKR